MLEHLHSQPVTTVFVPLFSKCRSSTPCCPVTHPMSSAWGIDHIANPLTHLGAEMSVITIPLFLQFRHQDPFPWLALKGLFHSGVKGSFPGHGPLARLHNCSCAAFERQCRLHSKDNAGAAFERQCSNMAMPHSHLIPYAGVIASSRGCATAGPRQIPCKVFD